MIYKWSFCELKKKNVYILAVTFPLLPSVEIMKNGGICGMPTDTVYVLVAACNRPDAVIKAYK